MILLPYVLDRIPELIGRFLAHQRGWVPVGALVTLDFDESGDDRLYGTRVSGVIRDVARNERGELANALVELDRPLDYAGHYTHHGIRTLVTVSRFRWHGLARLLVAAAAVSVVDVTDIAHVSGQRDIGRAVMRLRSRK